MGLWDFLDPTVRSVKQQMKRLVPAVNAHETATEALSDEELRRRIDGLRERGHGGEDLDALLVETLVALREVGRRQLGLRAHDVQLVGAAMLHSGSIAEMKTGEGKTLVASFALTLNAFAGKGAHLVTPNDYLAKRDAEWMEPIYRFCGLNVGVIQHDLSPADRLKAYQSDITYATNNELGFDYLRDNMASSHARLVQRELNYAIVDEVDSILVDEARTPLIISGFKAESSDLYRTADRVIRRLKEGDDYTVEERERQIQLTDPGTGRVESELGIDNLGDPENLQWVHHINTALKAHSLYRKDIDYVVRDGQVIIVDEFTGRLMFGRRYGEGIHQAIEAKESVKVEHETQTLATITFQNFFRLYTKLAGMTGTAKTEEPEFIRIYTMPVAMIPTNQPVAREDHPDVVYKTEEAKFRGITEDVLANHLRGQPSLVGTRSIEVSERLAVRLTPDPLRRLALAAVYLDKIQNDPKEVGEKAKEFEEILFRPISDVKDSHFKTMSRAVGFSSNPVDPDLVSRYAELLGLPTLTTELEEALTNGVPHNVLNAKYHEQEARIIAEAGRIGAVTIATNMAGRGVDIQLGGVPPEGETKSPDYARVKELGGLAIIGSERHESRRIDNQLRGRSGRQGDPGSSRFFVCLEDELWRLFGATDRMKAVQKTWRDNEPIAYGLLSQLIANAQKRVESHHFEMRKNVLKYDDVMNRQRERIYADRRRVLEGDDFGPQVQTFIGTTVERHVQDHLGFDRQVTPRDYHELITDLRETDLPVDDIYDLDEIDLRKVPMARLREDFYTAAKEAKCSSATLSTAASIIRELHMDEARFEELVRDLRTMFPVDHVLDDPLSLRSEEPPVIEEAFVSAALRSYEQKEETLGPEDMRKLERICMLQVVDDLWLDHLAAMDGLRDGIGLRAHGQIDPLVAYQKESYEMWEMLLDMVREEVVRRMFRVQLVEQQQESMYGIQDTGRGAMPVLPTSRGGAVTPDGEQLLPGQTKRQPARSSAGPGRNAPCPCGSGRKYKQCCMKKKAG